MSNYRYRSGTAVAANEETGDTLTQRVYQTLREDILQGRLPPGQRLVRREVAKRLGVSPIPVAEALLRLEVEGLVQSRPLYGSRVRPLTLEDVENDTVLREALECQAARVCAEKAGDSTLARLKTQARRLDKLMAEGDPHSQLGRVTHQEFHLAIARASACTSLVDELQRIWFRRLMWMNWIKATHYRRVPADWHQQLVAALATRDPERAEAKMREHVRYGHEDDREALRYFLEHSSDSTANGAAAKS